MERNNSGYTLLEAQISQENIIYIGRRTDFYYVRGLLKASMREVYCLWNSQGRDIRSMIYLEIVVHGSIEDMTVYINYVYLSIYR